MICRLTKKIIEKIIEFKKEHNRFLFHEILFPSLCIKYNLLLDKININKYIIYVKDRIY